MTNHGETEFGYLAYFLCEERSKTVSEKNLWDKGR